MMAVRASMQGLIDRLRFMTDAARTDHFNDITYWTDQQLQDVLDECRVSEPRRFLLTASTYYVDGSEAWYNQSVSVYKHYGVEDDFPVYNKSGVAVDPANYTYSFYGPTLVVSFNPDEVDKADYYAELTFYDMYAAAAEVWGRKASQRRALVEIRSGVHQIKANNEYQHCVDREKFFRTRIAREFDLPDKKRFTPASRIRG